MSTDHAENDYTSIVKLKKKGLHVLSITELTQQNHALKL